jgi:hypothetical protein
MKRIRATVALLHKSTEASSRPLNPSVSSPNGSALHVMLAKRFRVTVDQQRLPMVGRSTENHGHQRYVPQVWIAEV